MFAPFAALALVLAGFLSPTGQVARFVEWLGAPGFHTREAAGKSLIAIGEPALPALKLATKSTDPEVARRAVALVATITKQADTARTLAPTLIELDVRDKSLAEVLPLLEKQTGYKFQLHGVGKAVETPVTLKTDGKAPFWAVMEKLNATAGIVVASDYQTLTPSSQAGVEVLGRRGGRSLPAPTQPLIVPTSTLILRPKPVKPYPSSLNGAVRIEAIPYPAGAMPTLESETVAVLLQAIPEPKLRWERVQSFWITKALDENGRELATVATADGTVTSRVLPVQPGRVVFDAAGNLNVVPDGDRGAAEPLFIPNSAQTFVRLKVSNAPSKTLKIFEGVIRAVVQSGTEELMTTQLGGHAVGPNGVSLKTTTPVASEEAFSDSFACTVSLRYNTNDVRMEGGLPSVNETVWIGGGGRMAMRQQVGGAVFVNGKLVSGPDATPQSTLHGLRVTDDAGKPYLLAIATSRREIDQTTLWTMDEVKFILKPSEPGQGKPTKVTFSAGRSKTVDIPFQLRDVPLTVGNTP